MAINVTPERADVRKHIVADMRDANGAPLSDFRASGTPPTRADADQAIVTAGIVIRAKVGKIPDDVADDDETWVAVGNLMKETAAVHAALTLTRGMPNAEPEYDRLERLYEGRDGDGGLLADAIAAFREASEGEDIGEGDDNVGGSVAGSFPCSMTSIDEDF